MTKYEKPKGTWLSRTTIHALTIILGVLIFWVLGFLVKDIKTIEAPQYSNFEKRYADPALSTRKSSLESEIARLNREIKTDSDIQNQTEKSTRNLQATINQLIEIQKLDLQKQSGQSNQEQTDFYATLNTFLDNQTKYQNLNTKIAQTKNEIELLEAQTRQVQAQIAAKVKPAHEEHAKALRAHRLKLAFYQLLLLIPMLAVSSILMVKRQDNAYAPFFRAAAGAALVKVGLIAHEYFPTEYFKYILIGVLILVIGKFLQYLIQSTSTPKLETLLKQYKDAYKRFLCPICEHPICTGPRRYLYWTRRTVNKVMANVTATEKYTSYTCPACSTRLFEECEPCGETRHSLLPACENCGDEKPILNPLDTIIKE